MSRKNNWLLGFAGAGDSKRVSELLEQGAEINRIAGDLSPLLCAVAGGHFETVTLLVNKGADVNQPNCAGATPLMLAALNGRGDLAAYLISRGAKVNAKHRDRPPALIWAAYNGHTKVVKLLLQHGSDVNAEDCYGNTALAIAKSEGLRNLVRLLRREGAREPSATIAKKSSSVFSLQGGLPTLGKRR